MPSGSAPRAMAIDAPGQAQAVPLAPGLLWARVALPLVLDHVNIYLIEDDGGWAVVDTGVSGPATRAAFAALLSGPLHGQRFTRLIVTHHHPDHIGHAGQLCADHGLPLLTSLTAYLSCLTLLSNPSRLGDGFYADFYSRHGMAPDVAERMKGWGKHYAGLVGAPPATFTRLLAGDRLDIGGRVFDILSGDGHAPEQLMLYSRADNILLAADQVLLGISPNVSVWPTEPDSNPLGHYLRSLADLAMVVPDDALVLPGHRQPFFGLHARIAELRAHHEARLSELLGACVGAQPSVADLVPVLFDRPLGPGQLAFAFSETHAHVNHLLQSRQLALADAAGPLRYSAPRQAS